MTQQTGDVSEARRIDGSAMAQVEFPQYECILGWPVRGIWKPEYDGTDINAVSISFDDLSNGADPNRLVAVADDYGQVLLYRYPAIKHNVGADVGVRPVEYPYSFLSFAATFTNLPWPLCPRDERQVSVVILGRSRVSF